MSSTNEEYVEGIYLNDGTLKKFKDADLTQKVAELNSKLDTPTWLGTFASPKIGQTYTLNDDISNFRLIIIESVVSANGIHGVYKVLSRKPWAIYGTNWVNADIYQDASIITENPSYYLLLRFACHATNQITITHQGISTFTSYSLILYGIK